jgi:hypothetical protein
MARYTLLYAAHDQGSKTGRKFTSDCYSRRRSKHSLVSCVVSFVNYLQSVSLSLTENVLILFCGGWGVFVLFLFRSRSHPVPHRGERVKQRTMRVLNRIDFWSNYEKYPICLVLFFTVLNFFSWSLVNTFVFWGYLLTCYFLRPFCRTFLHINLPNIGFKCEIGYDRFLKKSTYQF